MSSSFKIAKSLSFSQKDLAIIALGISLPLGKSDIHLAELFPIKDLGTNGRISGAGQLEISDTSHALDPLYKDIRVTSRHKRFFLNKTLMFSLVAATSAERVHPLPNATPSPGPCELEIH